MVRCRLERGRAYKSVGKVALSYLYRGAVRCRILDRRRLIREPFIYGLLRRSFGLLLPVPSIPAHRCGLSVHAGARQNPLAENLSIPAAPLRSIRLISALTLLLSIGSALAIGCA